MKHHSKFDKSEQQYMQPKNGKLDSNEKSFGIKLESYSESMIHLSSKYTLCVFGHMYWGNP